MHTFWTTNANLGTAITYFCENDSYPGLGIFLSKLNIFSNELSMEPI